MRGRSDNRHSEELAKRREIICGSTFEPEPRAAKPWWPALEMNARLPFLEMVIIWSLCHHLRTCGPFRSITHDPKSSRLCISQSKSPSKLQGTYFYLPQSSLDPWLSSQSGILSELKTMYTFLTLDQFVGFTIFRMNAGNLLNLLKITYLWQLCAAMMSWVGRWVELIVYK